MCEWGLGKRVVVRERLRTDSDGYRTTQLHFVRDRQSKSRNRSRVVEEDLEIVRRSPSPAPSFDSYRTDQTFRYPQQQWLPIIEPRYPPYTHHRFWNNQPDHHNNQYGPPARYASPVNYPYQAGRVQQENLLPQVVEIAPRHLPHPPIVQLNEAGNRGRSRSRSRYRRRRRPRGESIYSEGRHRSRHRRRSPGCDSDDSLTGLRQPTRIPIREVTRW